MAAETRQLGTVPLVDFIYELGVVHVRIRQLALERFPIRDTAPQKTRPRRHRDFRLELLGKQAPELGMVPAQVVATAVTMSADSCSQTPHLSYQGGAVTFVQIVVHLPSIHRLSQPLESVGGTL
jgi:hypothetical protein